MRDLDDYVFMAVVILISIGGCAVLFAFAYKLTVEASPVI